MTTDTHSMQHTMPRGEDLARGRWPVTAVFFLNGLTLASYLVRLPSLKEAHHLGNGQMGAVGLLFAASALVMMAFVGRLVARHGSARVIRIGLLATPLTLGSIGLAGSFVTYAAASVLLGAVHGTIDVAMNAEAVAVERRLRRPILSGCHAAWSVSAIAASLIGAGLIQRGVAPAAHLPGVAAAVTLGGVVLGAVLTPSAGRPAAEGAERRHRGGSRKGWSGAVVRLGVAGMVLMVCEGAVLGWSGILLHDSRGASLAVASTAVMAFTGCQAAGRVVGDRLRLAYGDAALFRVGGLIGAGGMGLAVLSPEPAVAVAGFAVLGLGSSTLVPLTFSAVGRAAGDDEGAAAALPRFTTFTYAGILLGPAVIGWSAQLAGLQWTLAALVPLLGCVALAVRLPAAASRTCDTTPSAPRRTATGSSVGA